MPIHDYSCQDCHISFEEYHQHSEDVLCPSCHCLLTPLIGKLADYTGQASLTSQYVSRDSGKYMDSHITKLPSGGETSFLSKPPITVDLNNNRIR